ncbi:hypothetical protein [Allochromatium tepidum]|uniref:Uncharacterized protein n=1 Tax=Allochromatium tepidum TaxID=553982 RepID=A0ABM7QKA1_9GAMM|nr:hypothetical protein [Allochromatium tepidum]BCU06184.1 hypothetical protein Atep_08610 [Allochromatium tepidum]
MDYPNDVPYPQTLAEAQRRGIRVNAIQCGTLAETTREWMRIAQLGNGGYFQVEQSGGAVAIATPYDESLAKLSAELDETRIYYGRAEERAKAESSLDHKIFSAVREQAAEKGLSYDKAAPVY